MKKLFGLFLGASFALALALPATCQVWEEWVAWYSYPSYYEGDQANAIAVDSDRNVYVTGQSDFNYATIKYDSTGIQQWVQRYYGPTNYAIPTSIALDADGNVIVTGSICVNEMTWEMDYATIQYNSAGFQQWLQVYDGPASDGSDEASSIAVDLARNVYITGASTGNGTGYDYATIKYSAAGAQLWEQRYNGSGNGDDRATSIAVDDSGNVLVTGGSEGNGTYQDYATIKYNSDGILQWVRRYSGTYGDAQQASDLGVDADGNVCVTGWDGWSDWECQFCTVKYNSVGDSLWNQNYGRPGYEYHLTQSLAVDDIGNAYITGTCGIGTNRGYEDYVTIKYNTDGAEQWVAIYDGGGDDEAHSIALDAGRNVYVTGWGTGAWPGGYDYITIKYNSNGQEQWVVPYNGPASNNDMATSIVVDAGNKVYVTGGSYGIGTGFDYATIKYSQSSQVDITLTPLDPPIQIPASGGSFDFDANLTNNQTSPTTFDVWIMVQLPSMAWYGPVLGPVTLTLPGGASLTRLRTQFVPGSAPAGDYYYEGRVGDYPNTILDQDSFPFTKLGLDESDPGQEWSGSGESFENVETLTPHSQSLQVSVCPNPSNPVAILSFQLPTAGPVNVSVYDLSGRRMVTLLNGRRDAGNHRITFDGSLLPSGVYLYRITAGQQAASGKMVLLK